MQPPNFIVVRQMGPEKAVELLRSRFPDLAAEFSSPDNLEPHDPYHSYERFAEQVLLHRNETALIERAFKFVDELAESGHSLLQELLAVTVLESFAQDQKFADLLHDSVKEKARKALREVEERHYGRIR
jgi:hypothetical protein